VALLGVPLTDALRFASAEPAAFLGLDDTLGRIAPGYRADLVAFDPKNIEIYQVWVAGTPKGSPPEGSPPEGSDPSH
jgi:N-acetylglucosamine-6-phosphate deacetylase